MKAFGVTGIIQQCVRCYSLRNMMDEPEACPTCTEKLKVTTKETQPLVLCDLSNDMSNEFSFGFKDRIGHA